MNRFKAKESLFGDTVHLFKLTWAARKVLLLGTACAVALASVTPFVQHFAVGAMLNELVTARINGGMSSSAYVLLLFAVLAGSAFAISNTLQFFFKTVLYKELFQFLSVLIHEKMAMLDIATHENPKRKDLITKVQENAMWRAPDFMQRMAFLGQNLLEVLFATIILFAANWMIGSLLFLSSLPRLLVDIRYNQQLWRIETDVSEIRRGFWFVRHLLVDPRQLTEVKLFGNVPYFVGLLNGHLGRIKEREIDAEKKNLRWQFVALLISEGTTIFAVVLFVLETAGGVLEIGTLAFYLATLAAFRVALNSLSQNVGSQLRDGKFVRDMFKAFAMEPTLSVATSGSVPAFDKIGDITFENVSFAYPGTDKLILKNISFAIPGGSTLGLVAENGSGKSTLARLLCRIYDPTSGRILVNGIDLREIDPDWWQSQVGVMLQEFSHYEHLSIEDAIRLGRSNNGYCTEDVANAAIAADAHSFIAALPNSYQTVLGGHFQGGIELSGGQFQKLAIARMFYRKPKLAIFDEPTSAIDGEAEARIFDAIFDGLKGCSKILISHRFYTLRKADVICVITNGEIAELGNHKELMALNGIYAERYDAQVKEYL
jgi:ATP-binding cassette subfamily B protein